MTISNLQREHTAYKFRNLMRSQNACECPRCGEIELRAGETLVDNLGRPFVEHECDNCGHVEC